MTLVLQIVLLVLGAGGAIVFAAAITNQFWRGLSIGIFSSLGVLAAFLTITTFESPTAKPSEPIAAKIGELSGRQFVQTSREQLLGLYKDRTSLEGDRLARPYLGKWMSVSGLVRDIRPRGTPGRTKVFLVDPWADEYAFSESQQVRIEVLRRNDKISAVCRIDTIASNYIAYEDCELSDTKP